MVKIAAFQCCKSKMHSLCMHDMPNVPDGVQSSLKTTGEVGREHLIDARGLVARDGHDHVLQVKLCKGLVLDVHKRLAARYGWPAIDGERH